MTLSAPLKLLIVEDQPAIRKDIQAMIRNEPGFIVAGTCGSVATARVLIPAIEPELILLDVTLTDGTGFDMLQETDSHNYKVIFLTAHKDHAIRAIKFGALDYLLKPLDQEELLTALRKARSQLPVEHRQVQVAQMMSTLPDRQRIVLRSQEDLQVVELQEIVYCHSDAGYTRFYLSNGKRLLTSKYLKEYEDLLHEPVFLRVHQSYLVNNQFIDRYRKENNELVLRNGAVIPVATRRKEMLIRYLNGIQ